MQKAQCLARRTSILASPLLLICLSGLGIAQENCPISKWTSSAPACPSGGNTILSANFPTAAYVVSDDQGGKDPGAQEFAPAVVLEILKNSGDHLPLILMPVSTASFKRVQFQVRNFVMNHPEFPNRNKWLSAVVRSDARAYTWQQDYFESFFDPATGKPVLRNVEVYNQKLAGISSDNAVAELSKSATQNCPLFGKTGPKLATLGTTKNAAAYFGGNIEGLPGGLCLHGDNQPHEYAAQYCGSSANETIISTSWLTVGHVDEISGVVKDPSASPPCDFAITLASPSLAIQLLKNNPDNKFFSFYAMGESGSTDLSYRTGYSKACTLVKDLIAIQNKRRQPTPAPDDSNDPQKPNQIDGSGKAAWLNRLKNISGSDLITQAFAGTSEVNNTPIYSSDWPNHFDCTKITNSQVAVALETVDRARINNKLIQLNMDKAKKTIAAKIGERLPQCKVNFIEIPQIFDGAEPVENRGAKSDDPLEKKFSLRDNSLKSVLPNGTNALVVGNSVLSPHPQNAAFAQYMDKVYAKAGLKNIFIDTYDYAHVLDGNLHCSTHSIPICKPVAAARRRAQ